MDRLLEGAADRDWIVFLDDDDPLPDPTVLGRVRDFAEARRAADPLTGGVAFRGATFDARSGNAIPVLRPGMTGPVAADYLHGGFFPFYSVAAVREVGVFRAELFFEWADLDYGLRLRASGYDLWVSSDLWNEFAPLMGHPEELVAPQWSLGPANARRFYLMRNRYHLLRTYGRPGSAARVFFLVGIAKPLANLARTPRLALAHLRLNLRAAWDARRRRYGVAPEPWGAQPPSAVEEEEPGEGEGGPA